MTVTNAPAARLRTDLWVERFDGTYRLFLDPLRIAELERKCGGTDRDDNQRPDGVFAIYGRVAKGRYELEGKPVGFAVEGAASLQDCFETVRLALIGGGYALVEGEEIKVDARRAKQLVETYLAGSPIEEAWNLAYLVLHTLIHGRDPRGEEAGKHSREPVFPAEPNGA